ncbi:MAG: hypothetical protein ABIR06_08975 [Cyclobacteriaceae bacterium]
MSRAVVEDYKLDWAGDTDGRILKRNSSQHPNIISGSIDQQFVKGDSNKITKLFLNQKGRALDAGKIK